MAEMFTAISPTYDLLNHALSLNIDRHWRTITVGALAAQPGESILDLCTGTGDLALALLHRAGARVTGADFSAGMLRVAREKAGKRGLGLPLVQADALALPFTAGSFDAATVAFGVRNFQDLDAGLREISRVLKPGGRLAILEFSSPDRSLFGALYRFYFREILPFVGRLVSGDSGAYAYLPATVERFPDAPELATKLNAAGFTVLQQRRLTGGIATLHSCSKTGPSTRPTDSDKLSP